MRILNIFKRGIVPLSIGLVFFSASIARAAVFVVTDTNDTIKITSLRGACIAANRIGGNSTIILGMVRGPRDNQQRQWIYRLTISGANEEAGRTGDLNITRGRLTIISANSNVVIDATGLGDRVFQVSSNAHLTLENLAVRGGTAPGGTGIFADGEPGGAIFNAGTLILEHCVITNNASGGGQYVEGNGGGTGGGDGGGIYNTGALWANECAIVGNSSGAGFDGIYGGNGGGIRNDGFCFLTNCTVSGNYAGGGGGPAGNAGGFGSTGGNGGGIFNSGTMILGGCVIGANAAGLGASGGDPSGLVSIGAPGGGGAMAAAAAAFTTSDKWR
jgi:hypothetical protein